MARWTVCSEPGCGELHQGSGRCRECRREHEKQRGTRQARGYGQPHEQAKAELKATGATHCVTCGEAFTGDNPMTAGHVVAIRNGGTSADGVKAECRRCNYGWERTGS